MTAESDRQDAQSRGSQNVAGLEPLPDSGVTTMSERVLDALRTLSLMSIEILMVMAAAASAQDVPQLTAGRSTRIQTGT